MTVVKGMQRRHSYTSAARVTACQLHQGVLAGSYKGALVGAYKEFRYVG